MIITSPEHMNLFCSMADRTTDRKWAAAIYAVTFDSFFFKRISPWVKDGKIDVDEILYNIRISSGEEAMVRFASDLANGTIPDMETIRLSCDERLNYIASCAVQIATGECNPFKQ